jgi:hypothetical protein
LAERLLTEASEMVEQGTATLGDLNRKVEPEAGLKARRQRRVARASADARRNVSPVRDKGAVLAAIMKDHSWALNPAWFRATKDLDVVLCVEAVSIDFAKASLAFALGPT